MTANTVNPIEQIVPQGEIRRFSMGGTHTDVLKQIFGEWPENEPEHDVDSRRETAQKVVREILFFYYHEQVFDRFLYDGFLDGLTHFDRLLTFLSFQNTVKKAHDLVENRLGAIAHIETVFFTSSVFGDRNRTRVDQQGRQITENESYVFAVREGLRYGLSRALSLVKPGLQAPPSENELASVEHFHAEQIEFVRNQLPKSRVKYADRFVVKGADVLANGLQIALDFLNDVSMFEIWKRTEAGLYNMYNDPRSNRFKRIHARKDLQTLFVKSLRANKQMFHMFRLGCGFTSCRPAQGNLVFNLGVPAENVPSCHIADAIDRLENPSGSRENWWLA